MPPDAGCAAMTAGPHRRGRRDNGLHASEYAVAGDVDPRVGEHLLDVLGLAGIAAYLQPTADLHPVIRTTTLPSRPIDRLYVDRAHLSEAREYLAELGPAAHPSTGADTPPRDPTAPPPSPPTVTDEQTEAAWAQIIASYDAPADAPIPPWPVEEDVSDPPASAEADTSDEPADEPAPKGEWRGGRADLLDTLDAEDEEGYKPPPPPPIPRPSGYAVLGVLAIAVGLVICIRPDLLSVLGLGDGGALTIGFVCLLAGFVTLIIRLRPGNDPDDDDEDDGAVV